MRGRWINIIRPRASRVVRNYNNYSYISYTASACSSHHMHPVRAVSLCPRNFIIVLFLVRTYGFLYPRQSITPVWCSILFGYHLVCITYHNSQMQSIVCNSILQSVANSFCSIIIDSCIHLTRICLYAPSPVCNSVYLLELSPTPICGSCW